MSTQIHIQQNVDSKLESRKQINILLIDDDKAAHILHKIAIEDAGYDMEKVKSFFGVDMAMAYLKTIVQKQDKSAWPEYIFLDINMPMKTGYDFINEFSLLKNKFGIPKIYLVSSSDNPTDIRKANEIELIYSFKTKFMDKEFLSTIC